MLVAFKLFVVDGSVLPIVLPLIVKVPEAPARRIPYSTWHAVAADVVASILPILLFVIFTVLVLDETIASVSFVVAVLRDTTLLFPVVAPITFDVTSAIPACIKIACHGTIPAELLFHVIFLMILLEIVLFVEVPPFNLIPTNTYPADEAVLIDHVPVVDAFAPPI